MRHLLRWGDDDRANSFETIETRLRDYAAKVLVGGLHVSVRFNTSGALVVCRDRERRNAVSNLDFATFLRRWKDRTYTSAQQYPLWIELRALGIERAQILAKRVTQEIRRARLDSRRVFLCSSNEYCVDALLDEREENHHDDSKNDPEIGVISGGVPMGLFAHLRHLDFVVLPYDVVCEDLVTRFAETRLPIIVDMGRCGDSSMMRLMTLYQITTVICDDDSSSSSDTHGSSPSSPPPPLLPPSSSIKS